MQRRAGKAAELGISFAEYVRRLVANDLGEPKPRANFIVFDLVDQGPPTNIARDKDKMIGEAVWQNYLRKRPSRLGAHRPSRVGVDHVRGLIPWFAAVVVRDEGNTRAKSILRETTDHVTTDHVVVETWLLLNSGITAKPRSVSGIVFEAVACALSSQRPPTLKPHGPSVKRS